MSQDKLDMESRCHCGAPMEWSESDHGEKRYSFVCSAHPDDDDHDRPVIEGDVVFALIVETEDEAAEAIFCDEGFWWEEESHRSLVNLADMTAIDDWQQKYWYTHGGGLFRAAVDEWYAIFRGYSP